MSVPFSIRRVIAGTYVLNVAVIRAIFEVRCKCLAQTLNDRARDLRHVCRSLQINSEGQSGVRSEHRVSPDAFGGGRVHVSRGIAPSDYKNMEGLTIKRSLCFEWKNSAGRKFAACFW